MQLIGDSTNTANGSKEFTQGQPGAGVDATIITAAWLNTIQRELANLIIGSGLTLDPLDDSQLLKSIKKTQTWASIAGKPSTLAGYGITDAYTKAQLDPLLAAKLPVSNAALAGTPTCSTAVLGTANFQIANTLFVENTVRALIAAAPGALDTLAELAAALGNDPNFATTITNALAAKAPLLSPALTGRPTAPTANLGERTDRLATTLFVGEALADLTADPWAVQPIGVPLPVTAGAPEPPKDRSYRYIKLTYNDPYNAGVLTGEVMTGVAPLVVSYGRVSLSGSPITGNTVYMINTERRYIRPGAGGSLQNDAVQNITATLGGQIPAATAISPSGAFSCSAPSWSAGVNVEGRGIENLTFDASRVVRTDNETRTKNIGANFYMRIK